MSGLRKAVPSFALICGSLLVMSACATAPRPGTFGGLGARPASDGPTKEACAELPALTTRLARLERERTRIHEKLAAAGFERTSAEALSDGTGAPGLAIEAVRSADALEKMLADRTPVYTGLGAQIDWIAANWFDPALMRWTSAEVRALTSMNEETFRDLKAETVSLRAMLPDIASAKRRQDELKGCGAARRGKTEDARTVSMASSSQPPGAAPSITCGPATTKVNCNDTTVVQTVDLAAAMRPLNSSSMTRDELSALGPDTSAWIAFARSAAGANDGPERVYVDGMPALASVSPATISRITVNGDPFSAEYSRVGETRIDIALSPPERRWHVDLSSPSIGAGGGSLLGSTGTPVSRNTSLNVSGPVPWLPLTFSAHETQHFDARTPLFVTPGSGALAPTSNELQTTDRGSDLVLSAALATKRVIARATFSDSRMAADHAGIGVTNGPTTGQRLDSERRTLQTSWRVDDGDWIHRGGLSFAQDRLAAVADSLAPLVMITGQFVTGGDELAANTRRSDAWTVKHVVETVTGRWSAGVDVTSERVSDERVPNPYGRLQFSAIDAGTPTWTVTTGRSAAAVRTTSAALFAEQLSVHTPRVTVRSGLRIDWQNRAGAFLSPRVVAVARWSKLELSGGAGVFVEALSPDLFALAAERDGTQESTFVVHDVSGGAIEGMNPSIGERLRMALAPGFAPRRDLVLRAGVQRSFGPVRTGIEHTWTRGESLPGAERQRDAAGLVDWISSDRALRRHQTYVRSSMRRGPDSISAYYQHVWSFDNSDGPFVAPARQGDVDGEWAPSAGVARHAAGVTGIARLPGQIHASLSVELRSGTPYAILTGADPEGLAVFTDRGGLPRNAGTLPSFGRVSLSLARTVRVPRANWLAFDVGVRADNLTNHLNVTSVGRVVGTSAFGLPIDATAGRSIRFWATLAR